MDLIFAIQSKALIAGCRSRCNGSPLRRNSLRLRNQINLLINFRPNDGQQWLLCAFLLLVVVVVVVLLPLPPLLACCFCGPFSPPLVLVY